MKKLLFHFLTAIRPHKPSCLSLSNGEKFSKNISLEQNLMEELTTHNTVATFEIFCSEMQQCDKNMKV